MNRVENVFVIEWKGPFYDVNQIRDEDFENSFYLITGKTKYQKQGPFIQYCGISKKRSVFKRLTDKNHKHNMITREKEIWIGQFSNTKHNLHKWIELAESLIIYHWQVEQNVEKKNKAPKSPLGIINRWQTTNGEYRHNRVYPAQHLDDVIIFDGENL
jgi:hypothetical protein